MPVLMRVVVAAAAILTVVVIVVMVRMIVVMVGMMAVRMSGFLAPFRIERRIETRHFRAEPGQ